MGATQIYFLLQVIYYVQCLNYGPPNNFPFFRPAGTKYVQGTNLQISPENQNSTNSNLPLRKTGVPYTIFYPLTFTSTKSDSNLNFTLPSKLSATNQVESRILNKPELYPTFGLISSPTEVTKDSEEESYQLAQEIPEEYYDDSKPLNGYTREKNNVIDESIATKSDIQTINLQTNFPVYYNKSSNNAVSTSGIENKPSKGNYIPSLGYGKHPPPTYKLPIGSSFATNNAPFYPAQLVLPGKTSSSLSQSEPIYNKPEDSSNAFPPIGNSFPKVYIDTTTSLPPPQGNNKTPFPIPLFPPPVRGYKRSDVPPVPRIQHITSCICVPFYLCKSGILNAGGRPQRTQKRQTSSISYNAKNKTIAEDSYQSNIINLNENNRNSDQGICEPNKVCCQIYFEDNTDDVNNDDIFYPVATPPPDSPGFHPLPTRFPSKSRKPSVCGTQRVSGVQSKLKLVQYPADVAEFGEYPWQVAILKKVVGDKNMYLCGGVLIAPQWIATVAHCIKKYSNSPLLIRLGEWDVNRKDEAYPYVQKEVSTITVHPDFDPESLQSDLALIRMTDPISPKLPHIVPACLPRPGQIYDDQTCWVSGWGKNFFGSQGEYQNVLKEVDLPVVSRSLCNTQLRSTKLGPDFTLHPGFLCAGGESGKDACTGDGGSPLVCKSSGLMYVVGLVSWGIGCGQAGVPGVYVNMLYYADWINSVIGQ